MSSLKVNLSENAHPWLGKSYVLKISREHFDGYRSVLARLKRYQRRGFFPHGRLKKNQEMFVTRRGWTSLSAYVSWFNI